MTDGPAIVGSGRIAFGGTLGAGVPSGLWLADAGRDGSVPWTSINTFYYRLNSTQPLPFGLIRAVGPPGGGLPYSGIQVDGDGSDVRIDLRLNSGGIGFPIGVNHIRFRLLQNGAALYEENVARTATHSFQVIDFQTGSPDVVMPAGFGDPVTLTGVTVAAGDIFTTDYQYENNSALNVFGRAEGGPYLRIFGTLRPPGGVALRLRGSGSLAAEL